MEIRKHLTVVNRGKQEENQKAIKKVINRYLQKMTQKGWKLDRISEGDEFLKYGAYVHLCK